MCVFILLISDVANNKPTFETDNLKTGKSILNYLRNAGDRFGGKKNRSSKANDAIDPAVSN